MEILEILLGLLAACVALALAARRLHVPLAVALVLGGMALALVPGLPTIELDPQLALVLFLPPLLQASAYRTDWPAFRANLRPILLLALGAVLFTAAVVAVTAKMLVPDLPWAAAIALGAIVAPPDAVAATSVLKNFRLPKRIVTVLEGESLLNDASALVLYRFAVTATMAGAISFGEASLAFLAAAAGRDARSDTSSGGPRCGSSPAWTTRCSTSWSPSSPASPPTSRPSTSTAPGCWRPWPAASCSARSSTRPSPRAPASRPRRSGTSSSSCSPRWCSSSSGCSSATSSAAWSATTRGTSRASASPSRRR